jgi:hypothetical protein
MLFVFDIDNCLSDGRRRSLRAGPEPDRNLEPARYEAWKNIINTGIEDDEPVPGMCELVACLDDVGHTVVYMTARGESLRQATRDWLRRHAFRDLRLVMRPEHDDSKSASYKAREIEALRTSPLEDVMVWDDDERGELEAVCRLKGWVMHKATACLGGKR